MWHPVGTAPHGVLEKHDEPLNSRQESKIKRTMRILHFYNQQNDLQTRYISLLLETMAGSVVVKAYNTLADIKKELDILRYDILHIHGCWSVQYAKAATYAKRKGVRVIISPHGELEPWILRDRQWQEKMPKTILYQRQTIQEAYVVIAMGTMERESLEKLGWNPRIETIRNAIITQSITIREMTQQLLATYRKVMDSDVYQLMNDDTRKALFLLLKAAVSEHPNWLHGESVPALNSDEWRQILIYAKHEEIEHLLKHGIHVLGMKEPMTDVSQVNAYFPANYTPVKSIAETIGNKFVSENKRLLATFKYLHRLCTSQQLAMAHIMELAKEIRGHDIDEEQLQETLEEERLLTFASRLMGVLENFGQMEEGIMPVPSVNDKQTEKLGSQITNRLKI